MAAGPDTLVVAALAEELGPFLAAIDARRVRHPGPARLYHGRLEGHEIAAAIVGDGADRAREALEGVVASRRPRRGLLLGVAGALSPDLEIGSVIPITAVAEMRDGTLRWVAEARPGQGGGTALSTRRVVGRAAEKVDLWRRLGEPQRAVVDLETAVFVEVMQAAGADWSVIRAVSDAAGEDLPVEVTSASTPEGHVRRARVVAALARRPWRLGRLLVLRRRVRLCAAGLAAAAGEWIGREGG